MSTSDGGALIAGRYRLSSELGRGAMGVVWLARDERLGRTVAVKELRGGVGLSETQVEQSNLRARREARIAARLHHPNAVAVYDVAEHEGRPYLIMEYVRARTLSETLAEEQYLDPVRAAEIGVQLASALAAAHEAGIVHRDVKPGNILLSEDGKAKLTDFGISRAVGDATVTGTGEMLGTPAYVAPEVAQGRTATASSDVFSLGATLYAAVEGEPPFGTGPAVMALLLRIVNGELRPPRRSGLLTETMLRMLQTEPMDRPSMDAARHELQAVAGSALSMPTQSPRTLPTAKPGSMRVRARTPQPTPDPAPSVPPAERTPGAEQSPDTHAASAASIDADAPAEHEAGPEDSRQPEAGAPADAVPEVTVTPSVSLHSARPRRLAPWAVLGVAAVLTAGIVAAIVASSSGGSGGSPAAHSSSQPTKSSNSTGAASPAGPAGSTTSKTSTSPAAKASPSSSAGTAASSASGDVATQLSAAISAYYQLVPNDLDQAWTYLTADYQQNHAGGMSGFTSFWQQIQSVAVSGITAEPPSSVVATLEYHYKDGRTIRERTQFGLVQSGGIWKIASSSVLSSTTS